MVAEAQFGRLCYKNLALGRALVAYIHVAHGKKVQLLPISAKEADTICAELFKQVKGAAGMPPVPNLNGHILSGAGSKLCESPPLPREWPASETPCSVTAKPVSIDTGEVSWPIALVQI